MPERIQPADEGTTWSNRPASPDPALQWTARVFEDCLGRLVDEMAETQRRRFAEEIAAQQERIMAEMEEQITATVMRPSALDPRRFEAWTLLGFPVMTPPTTPYERIRCSAAEMIAAEQRAMGLPVVPGEGPDWRAAKAVFERLRAQNMQDEYMAWRRERRVDPAAGPEAHALEPTLDHHVQFGYWRALLAERADMAGLSFPEFEEGYAARQ